MAPVLLLMPDDVGPCCPVLLMLLLLTVITLGTTELLVVDAPSSEKLSTQLSKLQSSELVVLPKLKKASNCSMPELRIASILACFLADCIDEGVDGGWELEEDDTEESVEVDEISEE